MVDEYDSSRERPTTDKEIAHDPDIVEDSEICKACLRGINQRLILNSSIIILIFLFKKGKSRDSRFALNPLGKKLIIT